MNNTADKKSAVPKRRHPLERAMVWGGIIALLVVVGIEFKGKQGYDASVGTLQELANGSRDIPLDEARQAMVGYYKSDGPLKNEQGLNTYSYAWFSLFRSGTYQVTLTADSDEKTLKTFDGPAFAEDPDDIAATIEAANAEVSHDVPTFGTVPQAEDQAKPTETTPTAAEQPQPAEGDPPPAGEPQNTPASTVP